MVVSSFYFAFAYSIEARLPSEYAGAVTANVYEKQDWSKK
jgi:hypothetical protein